MFRQGLDMSLTNDQLGKAIVASGIMPAEELKAFWSALPPEQRPKNGETFAKVLIEQQKLTKFQASELLSGNNTPLVLGDYVLQAKIGAGGMGQVFKAHHRHMERMAAIKLLPPELTKDTETVKRFQREVKAAAKLSHPNIVQTFDASNQRGVWYLVMEYVEGSDLADTVAARGQLPIATAINYIRQAAKGLAFAHKNGVVHRDIKPANLLLDKEGTVKILDMGLARLDDGMAAAKEGLTQSGQVMGTVDYMAPEQAFDTRHADARADIYSLGCTLYRLLTGRNMYDGESLVQKLMAHQTKPIPLLSKVRADVPTALVPIFAKMVAKQPTDRYQTMGEVEAALAALDNPTALANPSTKTDGGGLTSYFKGLLGGKPEPTAAGVAILTEPTTAPQLQPIELAPTVNLANPLQETDPVSARSIQLVRQNIPRPSGGKKPPIWKRPIVMAAGGLGVLALLLGIWVIIKDKDGNEIARVQVPEGGAAEVKNVADATPSKAAVTTSETAATKFALDFNYDAPPGQARVELPPVIDTRNPFTVEMYTTVRSAKWAHRLFFSNQGNAQLSLWGSSTIEWSGPNRGVTKLKVLVPDGVPMGERTHLAAVFTGKELQLFINGKDQGKSEATLWKGKPFADMGGLRQHDPAWKPLDGTIDDVRISTTARYTTAFTPPAELSADKDTLIRYDFKEGSGDVLKDSSGNNHHGKIVGAKWVAAQGNATSQLIPATDYGLRFAGLGQYTRRQASGNSLLVKNEPWTIEGWVCVDPVALIENGPGYLIFFDKDFNFTAKLAANKVLRWHLQGGDTATYANSQEALIPHQPQHVAVTYDKNKLRLFVNGKQQCEVPTQNSEATATFSVGPNVWSAKDDRIGFHGTMAEVRLSNIVRYQEAFTPPQRMTADASTLALYHLDDGQGSVAKDSTSRANHIEVVGATWFKANKQATTANKGWTPLFDGKTLSGWKRDKEGFGDWKVADGAITCSGAQDYLLTERDDYADFHLRAECKISDSGNSGLYFRASKPFSIAGDYEAQINSTGTDNIRTGSLYKVVNVADKLVPADTWFTYDIIAEGNRIRLLVNGKQSVEYTETRPNRNAKGRIGLQQNGGTVQFRKIEIRELKLGDIAEVVPPLAKAPFDATQAKAHQTTWAQHLGTTVETTNSVGAKMVLIPPGEFLMGSSDADITLALKIAEETKLDEAAVKRIQAESPQHKVVITKPLLMSATEVTIGQFKKFSSTGYLTEAEIAAQAVLPVTLTPTPGQSPVAAPKSIETYLNPGYVVTDDSPAAMITWNDAVAYCKWLSDQEKRTYRLPTEAEWEYACRAGTTTQYLFGDDYAELEKFGWYQKNASGRSHSVGTKLPNPFGLFDIHGNLHEWCQDVYGEKWYGTSPPDDPSGPAIRAPRVNRGGSLNLNASHCRSAARNASTVSTRNNTLGFRFVSDSTSRR